MLDPLISTIEVPCGQEDAFKVFVEDMGSWWPLDKRSMSMFDGKPAKSVSLDAKVGGKIIEIAHDGKEHLWGTVKTFDPFDSISMDFHMGLPASTASLVTVVFTKIKNNSTKVVLTQSNWESFGDLAEKMRGGYGSGWILIFEEAYKAACSK